MKKETAIKVFERGIIMVLVNLILIIALYVILMPKVTKSPLLVIIFGLFGGALFGAAVGVAIGIGKLAGGIIGAVVVIWCLKTIIRNG